MNIGILDREVAGQLRAAFAADLRHARQRTLPEWRNRGVRHKLMDGLAYLGAVAVLTGVAQLRSHAVSR